MSKNKNYNLFGWFGFLGFMGFQYFSTNNLFYLSQFSLFGLFSFFLISKSIKKMSYENFNEKSKVAKEHTLSVAIIEFILLAFITPFNIIDKELLIIIISLCFISLLMSYAIILNISKDIKSKQS